MFQYFSNRLAPVSSNLMTNSARRVIVVAVLLGFVSFNAIAQSDEQQELSPYCSTKITQAAVIQDFKSCWYVGGGYGLSHVKPRGLSGNGWFTGDDSDSGYLLNIGWRFKPRWFAELQYSDLGAAGLSNTDPNREQAIPNAEITYKVPSLMVGYRAFEWWDQFSVYGKLGVASIENKPKNGRDANLANPVNSIDFEEQTSTQIVGGFGLEWQPRSSRWFARLNYDSFDKDASFLSLSINAYLGKPTKSYRSQEDFSGDRDRKDVEPETLTTYIEAISARSQELAGIEEDSSDSDVEMNLQNNSERSATVCTLPDLGAIYFDSNRWAITPTARAQLQQYAAFLNDNRAAVVELVGHADGSGAANVNEQIARQRSRHVFRFLSTLNVDGSQLRYSSAADSQPVASNDTAEGRAANRRVELRAICPE